MKQMLLFDFVDTETKDNAEHVVSKKPHLGEQTQKTTESNPTVNTDLKIDRIIEPEGKTQASDITIGNNPITAPAPSCSETIPVIEQFPGIDENNPNKPLWDEIESGNFDRNSIIERYKTLGETAVIENDRGLIDSHRRRAAHLGQFFTPTRDEPDVIKSIKIPDAKIEEMIIKPDAAQVAHYKKWLDQFANRFKQQLELEKEGGHKIDQMIILAHLTKLQFASTIPQSPSTNFTGFEWIGDLTTKQAKTLELIKEAIANKEKIIVYSERPEFQKFIQTELKKINIASHVFIGEQGIDDRNVLLDDFKNNGTNVLLATTTCGGTGLNIPEANVVVIADTSWTPARQIQAYSRILRPQQKKQPRITLLRCDGTIDMYMRQLMNAKSNAINQGIDHSEYEEIDMKKWLSYRDFTIKMLKDEGYDIN